VVDDSVGRTLASASTMEGDLRGLEGDKTLKAKRVGLLVAERAKARASSPWSSTAAATVTTAGSPRSPMAPARVAWRCDRNGRGEAQRADREKERLMAGPSAER